MTTYYTIKCSIELAPDREAVVRDAMFCATKVYNGILWHLRDEYERGGAVTLDRGELYQLARRELPRANGYFSQSVVWTIREVIEAYQSFHVLRKNGKTEHHAPGFRRSHRLSKLMYHQSGFAVHLGPNGISTGRISLGTRRLDGERFVSFVLHHRPDLPPIKRVRNLIITYDTAVGQLRAHLVVEVDVPVVADGLRAAVDLGETQLIAAVFEDDTRLLYGGGVVKTVRRYWQKVRASVRPPSQDNPHLSRHYRQIRRKEALQVRQLIHTVTSHFVEQYAQHAVTHIVVGDLSDIRRTGQAHQHGSRPLKQRLHAWAFHQLLEQIRYKAALRGIRVTVTSERYTSQTCSRCGHRSKAARRHRGLYRCPECCYTGHADLNAARNIFHAAFRQQVIPGFKGDSGSRARPAVLSFQPTWNGIRSANQAVA